MSISEKYPDSTAALITSLHHVEGNQPKAIRSHVHLYPPTVYAPESSSHAQARERRITSWKMTEHMYRLSDNPFPTLARGLFTEEIEEGDSIPEEARQVEGVWTEDGPKRARIVARGYDKFFNVNEVDWTGVSTAYITVVDEG
jgi:tRNA ligase